MKSTPLEIKTAYKEVLEVLKKHKQHINLDIDSIELKSKSHLYGVELVEKYGFDLDPTEVRSNMWVKYRHRDMKIITMGTLYGREISYSDNDEQPIDETLLEISYPTGAYFLAQDYPVELFKKLWDELKSYNYKYIDTANSCLYYALDNAGTSKLFNNYDSIIKKYYDLNKEDAKKRKIKRLKADIEKLEG